jgi:hypothetical protein
VLQEAYITYAGLGDALKFDFGYTVPPLSHNALQGAATLYSWDFFANSFRHGAMFNTSANPAARDAGVQIRGLLGNFLEYRAGLYQGRRSAANDTDVGSRNPFRAAGRVQLNFLDPETGYYYAGTYFGMKQIFSLGAACDIQDAYRYTAADAFLDVSFGPGVLTAQVDVARWDGHGWLDMPEQMAVMGEAGYLIRPLRWSPIGRFERRWVEDETNLVPDETRLSGGMAFWPYGHNMNVKAFYTRVEPSPAAHAYGQLNVQSQLFIF